MTLDDPPGMSSNKGMVLGFFAGLLLGMTDYFFFRALSVSFEVEGQDVTIPVVLFFATTFGVLGAVIARLWGQRRRLRQQATLIQEQVERLRQTQARLIDAEKLAAVGRLASGVAHEVRNPLGVIRSSASLVLEDFAPQSDAHEAASFIVDEVDRLNGFVTRLLDFTRPLEPQMSEVHLGELLQGALAEVERECRERGIEVEVDAAATTLRADEQLLSRLLVGLLANAIQALGDGGRIEIRGRHAGTKVVLEVVDDGPGVAEEHRKGLFEPFFTTRPDGTGLGLAMAQKIAELHNAKLEYQGEQGLGSHGRGACFRCTVRP